MARPVKGFLADDGTFFDSQEDVDLYDALHALRFHVTQIGANPEKFLIVLDGCARQVKDYLDAKEAYNKAESRDNGTNADPANGTTISTPLGVDHTKFFRPEEDASIQQQSIDGTEHVPDMGSSISAETVPNDSKIDGVGSGVYTPRSVRRSAHMATTSQAAITRPRSGDGASPVREAEGGKTVP